MRWYCLDIGETLIDETRVFATWADLLGVPRFTLAAVLGGIIARGQDHVEAFAALGFPNVLERMHEVELAYGGFREEDLYPDARRCLSGLVEAGYQVAVVANQPASRTAELRALGIDPPVLAMSEAMGVRKPDPAFFAAALALMDDPDPGDVCYVGDRVDNDVLPAAAAGLRTVRVRRGPWGYLQPDETGAATLSVTSLDELLERVDEPFQSRPPTPLP
jgi:FMN hydrolase / 5-amino-6-(5-phospho-D-ribitylamino)uracil phosphatase